MIPVIDLSSSPSLLSSSIRAALRSFGFFYVINHSVPISLISSTLDECKKFFELPSEIRNAMHMKYGGKAWRGYFNLGEELTSGKRDVKEGIYFGEECAESDLPLHGPNQWPPSPHLPSFQPSIMQYFSSMRELGMRLLQSIALSLGLRGEYFEEVYCRHPTMLFRVFHYVGGDRIGGGEWGVGEHTDYGMLTILKQDNVGGLQIKLPSGEWIDAPPLENSFIINIGDMLEAITGGYYLSTPHRVKKMEGNNRISLPFFMDPNWESEVRPLDLSHLGVSMANFDEKANASIRWDKTSPMSFRGKYGDYLMLKVGKVFPELMKAVEAVKEEKNADGKRTIAEQIPIS